MLKRLIGGLLAAILLFSALPLTTLAIKSDILYGDVNSDTHVDLNDLLVLKRYIAEENPSDFSLENADVNSDKAADISDLLLIKKFIAEWPVQLGPDPVSVSFYDGDRLIETLSGKKGLPLGEVPAKEKTSRSDAVFAGWYTDPEFTTPFYADEAIFENTTVYAKYDELQSSELTVSSFAQTDLGTDASFTAVGIGNLTDIQLVPKDGSDPVELTVSGDGPYTIAAKNGFKEGASYELTLPEGLNFVGSTGETLPETVRTASFTIKKEAVDNLQLSESTHFVKNANPSALAEGSTVALSGVKSGDLICFYKTTSPELRDYKSGNAYMDDPETWFKASSVNDGTVTLGNLDANDNEKLYDIPDNFPVTGALPAGDSGVLTLDGADNDGYALDTDFYQQMVEEGVTANLAYAKQKTSIGDFISVYASSDEIDGDDDIFFGKITAYDSISGKITYIKSSAEEIESSMDLYTLPALEGDDLVSEEAKEQIEKTVLEQVKASGFAEEAGFMLADMATHTDGFRNMEGVQMLLTDGDGNPLSDDEIELLNIGKSFELKDGITLKVEIITSGDQIHFKNKGSVQLAIGIDAEFEVEVEDGGKIVIDLSATFVQELSIGITASGELVKKKILGIPVPIGVKVGSSVDILSYTAVRVDVRAYTVAEEDLSLWDQLKAVAKDPRSLADVLPDSDKFAKVKKGLETVGDVFDRIDAVNEQIEQVRDDVEQAQSYVEDLEMLWEMVGELKESDMPTKKKWEEMGKTLGKTNVSKDLMDMLAITTETELDADRYADGLEGLLTKYSEMLEQETDWVKLVEKEICRVEINILGLVIYCKADFVVRADMNIAMGTSIQYQVGKRYSFWMKIGLFIPEAGSSTMDLVDEEFAFQFYVMGKLGIKIGIKATVGLAIGSASLARVGLHIELGPYVKLYGFFIYEYERIREANTSVWESSERMAGSLYLDFGLYLIVGIDAAALNDLFEVSYDFIDAEFPLLEAGEKKYPYRFQYEPTEGEIVLVQDSDADSRNGITMTLPDEYRAVSYCNLETGFLGASVFGWDCYNYSFSNPAFSIDENGVISVDTSSNAQYMTCDLTLTYKYGKLAFSTYDMQVTIPLVWTNMPTDELMQYYTASVRVGNDANGYDTVWSKRVRKNQEFTLPSEDEIKALIGYNDAVYASLSFPDAEKSDMIITNTSYDCTIAYTDYAVRVDGIQNADGSTESKIFHTTYGGTFDFSSLSGTGTSKAGTAETAKYTVFSGVDTTATVTANGQEQVIDLSSPITGKVAAAILSGSVAATARYEDDSVLVTYTFSDIAAPDYTERIRKGTESRYDISAVAAQYGMAVKSVTPALGKVYGITTYSVECAEITGPSFTLSFEENGGISVNDIVRVGGSLIGSLPSPTRAGYTFGGWFADALLTEAFSAKLMPKENITVYALWTANKYTVALDVNGGASWTEGESPVTVTYDNTYGTLPVPTRDNHSFIGWFTAADGGEKVTSQTKVGTTGNHMLYAHWHRLVELQPLFSYTAVTATYKKDTQVVNNSSFSFVGEEPNRLEASDFTVRFMRQGSGTYCETPYPVDAGTWNAVITYPGDDYYAPYQQVCNAVIVINKATRTLSRPVVTVTSRHFSYLDVKVAEGAIDDLHPDAMITYAAEKSDGSLCYPGYGGKATSGSASESAHVFGLLPDTQYAVLVSVTGDPNYEDVKATGFSDVGKTNGAPEGVWNTGFSFGTAKIINISFEVDLAILAHDVNGGKDFADYTFNLTYDLDMSKFKWTPIGTESNPFKGKFNGNGHTIRGLYTTGSAYAGLFGVIADNASVSNLTVADSYISGTNSTGGIVGKMIASGNIDKQATTTTAIPSVTNCTNRATVKGAGADTNYGTGGVVGEAGASYIHGCVNEGRVIGDYQTSGIVGKLHSRALMTIAGAGSGQKTISMPNVSNCINYGSVKGTYYHTGGIVGLNSYGMVLNSVNMGDVTGSICVGGIAGQNAENANCKLINCYTTGTVKGSGNYVGAVIGRNYKDKGFVGGCYYLYQSATCNGAYRNATGTEKSSLKDGDRSTDTAYFTSPTSALSRETKNGNTNLITVLNNWVTAWNDGQCNAEWVSDKGQYPLPKGEINTQKGTSQT